MFTSWANYWAPPCFDIFKTPSVPSSPASSWLPWSTGNKTWIPPLGSRQEAHQVNHDVLGGAFNPYFTSVCTMSSSQIGLLTKFNPWTRYIQLISRYIYPFEPWKTLTPGCFIIFRPHHRAGSINILLPAPETGPPDPDEPSYLAARETIQCGHSQPTCQVIRHGRLTIIDLQIMRMKFALLM